MASSAGSTPMQDEVASKKRKLEDDPPSENAKKQKTEHQSEGKTSAAGAPAVPTAATNGVGAASAASPSADSSPKDAASSPAAAAISKIPKKTVPAKPAAKKPATVAAKATGATGTAAKPAGAGAGASGKPAGTSTVAKPAEAGTGAKPAASASKAAPKKAGSDSESSDDDDDRPLTARFAKAGAAAAVKKPAAAGTGSKPAAAKPKAPAKPKSKEEDSSSSDDSSDSDSSSDDSSSDDESEDEAPKRRTRTPSERKASASAVAKKKGGKLKVFPASNYQTREAQPLEATHGANKWWLRQADNDAKWTTLAHNGVLLPPPYVSHGVKMRYKGEPVELSRGAEEIATMYAAMLDTDYAKNPVFNKNFWNDWHSELKRSGSSSNSNSIIEDLKECDFSPIHKWVLEDRERKKEERKEKAFKERALAEKNRLQSIYGFAIVDGFKEKVGNFKVEPPGLFRGRGKHPKSGKLKKRLSPEDITINIGHKEAIPRAPEGHQWAGVVHIPSVTWLAMWRDNVNRSFKYVYLASSSRFKGESDMMKYTKAQELKKFIGPIRKNYNDELSGKTMFERQRATAIYLIDQLALRVGGDKDTKEEADTVGCCSLRREHITFDDEKTNTITLDFLGKDSMRYFNTVKVEAKVYRNLKEFCSSKKPGDDIFDRLTPEKLNDHLKSLMPGLSAKVFRTYNASITLEKELEEPTDHGSDPIPTADALANAKLLYYNRANRQVAILCNHQRSVPKGFESQMSKLVEQKQALLKEKKELEAHKAWYKKDKKGDKPDWSSEKPAPADAAKAAAAVERIKTRLDAYETKIALKDEGKTVALGTSKINYMDPRITVAWCKKLEMPIEKIFNKSLLDKFPWAMEVPSTWRF